MIAVGDKFSRWEVVARATPITSPCGKRFAAWVCRCECGTLSTKKSQPLVSGTSKSCGCFKREGAAARATKHGGSKLKIYGVFSEMHQRCENENSLSFPDYGARGIAVASEWAGFSAFFADMGAAYEEGLVLDRKDNDGPYCRSNCHWVTAKESARNKRSSLLVERDGKKVSLAALAESAGLKYMTVYRRFRVAGDSIERALRPVL